METQVLEDLLKQTAQSLVGKLAAAGKYYEREDTNGKKTLRGFQGSAPAGRSDLVAAWKLGFDACEAEQQKRKVLWRGWAFLRKGRIVRNYEDDALVFPKNKFSKWTGYRLGDKAVRVVLSVEA